jgi:hypothetical protein
MLIPHYDIRIERPTGAFQPLRRIADEANDVIGDRGHRQALDGQLQTQLRLGTAIHRLQEGTVLPLM